jgi:hypothetical protein
MGVRRATIAMLAANLLMAAGCSFGPAKEGSELCHGIGVKHRCMQFPYDATTSRAVAGLPVERRYRPATHVRCYSQKGLAVCFGDLRHGRLGFEGLRFRVHPDGSVQPICRSRAGGYRTSVFCTA